MIRGPYLHATIAQRLNGANDVCLRLERDPKCKLSTSGRAQYIERCATLQRRFPELRINEFERHHLDRFFTFDADDKPRVIGAAGWREGTVNAYLNAFCFVFGWCLKQGHVEHNPAAVLREDWGQKRVTHREGVWLTSEEITRLCDRNVGDDLIELRNRTLCQELVGTGAREFEAAALCWGQLTDIANPRGRIRVHGKGNKYRDITPLGVARAALVDWRRLAVTLRGVEPADTDPVIPAARALGVNHHELDWTTPLGTEGITRVIEQAGIRIGRPRLRPHDLRRSHAGFLEDSGVSLRSIKEQLGHSSLATTEVYLQNNPGRLADEFAKAGI